MNVGEISRRVNLRNDLPFLDRRIEIDQQLLDNPGNLAAYLHVDYGIQLPRSRDDLRHVSANHSGGHILRAVSASIVQVPSCGASRSDEGREPWPYSRP